MGRIDHMTLIVVPRHVDDPMPGLPAGRTIDTPLGPGGLWQRLAPVYEALAAATADADRPVVVSGGCNAAIAVLAGLQRAGVDPSVVWFDGHGDVQTLETTTSGIRAASRCGCCSATAPSSWPTASVCARCRRSG
jgi:arginase